MTPIGETKPVRDVLDRQFRWLVLRALWIIMATVVPRNRKANAISREWYDEMKAFVGDTERDIIREHEKTLAQARAEGRVP